jgi:hypothetical protein
VPNEARRVVKIPGFVGLVSGKPFFCVFGFLCACVFGLLPDGQAEGVCEDRFSSSYGIFEDGLNFGKKKFRKAGRSQGSLLRKAVEFKIIK